MLTTIYIAILIVLFTALGIFVISTINAPETKGHGHDDHNDHDTHAANSHVHEEAAVTTEDSHGSVTDEPAVQPNSEDSALSEEEPEAENIAAGGDTAAEAEETAEEAVADETSGTETANEESVAETEEEVPADNSMPESEEDQTPSGETEVPAHQEESPATTRVILEAPRNGQKDNLTLIKGVGIKLEEKLNGLGIFHFDQIAAWSDEDIAWVDSTLSFSGRIQRDGWIAQAKALAAGEQTEFSKRAAKGEVASSHK